MAFDPDTNDVDIVPAGQNSLLGVARHEFGHAGGLFHVDGQTLMYYADPGGGYPPRQIEHADQNGGIYELTEGVMHIDQYCASPQVYPTNCPTLDIQDGVSSVESNLFNVVVFPNPFNESISLRADIGEAGDMKVSIFDLLGQTVIAQDYGVLSGTVEESINTASLSMGMYLVKVSVGTGTVLVKLIKK